MNDNTLSFIKKNKWEQQNYSNIVNYKLFQQFPLLLANQFDFSHRDHPSYETLMLDLTFYQNLSVRFEKLTVNHFQI